MIFSSWMFPLIRTALNRGLYRGGGGGGTTIPIKDYQSKVEHPNLLQQNRAFFFKSEAKPTRRGKWSHQALNPKL